MSHHDEIAQNMEEEIVSGEDLLTYTELDPSNKITVNSATKVTVSGLFRNTDSWLYADKGVDYFSTDFSIDFEFYQGSSSNSGAAVGVIVLTNTVEDLDDLYPLVDGFQGCYHDNDGVTNKLRCTQWRSSTRNWGSAINVAISTRYYCTFERNESIGSYGQLKLSVFSDSGRTTHIAGSPSIVTLNTAKYDYRNLMAITTRNSGLGWQASFELENMIINTP